MKVRFWGTRGSIARPGPSTIHYGGNTSCVEIRPDDGTIIVIDCGSGAYGLGQQLMKEGGAREGHLLISHTHWDHILGFPFFAPLFLPDSKWHIYAPGGLGRKLKETLRVLMTYEYFPVELEALSASLQFHDLTEGMFELGNIQAMAHYLNHPGVTLGYRLETNGVAVVYSSDHEPHDPSPVSGRKSGLDSVAQQHREDERHVDFLRGADLVIHDTQYTEAEYLGKVGWGHTPAERAVQWGMAAGVKQLALYHHDPMHDDAFIDGMVENCREIVEADRGAPGLNLFAAAEGEVVTLTEDSYASPSGIFMNRSAWATELAPSRPKVLIIDDDEEVVAMMLACLEPDGYEVLCARSGEAGLELAMREVPDLILLDLVLPGIDGFTVCRRLRASESPRVRTMPVVLVTGMRGNEDNIGDGFRAGVSDYLLKPFKPTYLRARVHGWLQRAPARGRSGL